MAVVRGWGFVLCGGRSHRRQSNVIVNVNLNISPGCHQKKSSSTILKYRCRQQISFFSPASSTNAGKSLAADEQIIMFIFRTAHCLTFAEIVLKITNG